MIQRERERFFRSGTDWGGNWCDDGLEGRGNGQRYQCRIAVSKVFGRQNPTPVNPKPIRMQSQFKIRSSRRDIPNRLSTQPVVVASRTMETEK